MAINAGAVSAADLTESEDSDYGEGEGEDDDTDSAGGPPESIDWVKPDLGEATLAVPSELGSLHSDGIS